MIRPPSRCTTGRTWEKYSGTIGMFSRWMYCQTSSSVQLEIGNTRMLSPGCLRVLYRRHSSGRWFFGSQRCCAERKEKIRSLARDFSSSRRAPPKAASKPYLSSAWISPCVFQMSVCTAEPWVKGLMPCACASGLAWTSSSIPISSAIRVRIAYMSRNFHVVSTCSSGNGGTAG